MGLFGEVACAANDVVAAGMDVGDVGRAVGGYADADAVAHGHGVGGANAFEPESTFYFAVNLSVVVGQDKI